MNSFVVYIDTAGEFRWYLLAENGRKIADSGEGYRVRQDCEEAIHIVKRLVPKSKIDSHPRVETLIAS